MEDVVRTPLLTALAPVAWGSTYLVTQELLPADRPLLGGVLRALPVGLLLLAARRRLPHGEWWWRSTVLGGLNFSVFFVLVFVAAQRLPGGLAATLTATAPFVMMVLARLLVGERPAPLSVGAAVVGVLGVGLLVLRGGAVDPLGVAASAGAVLVSSLGFVLVKRWSPPTDLLTSTSWQLVAGGLLLVPLALVVEGRPPALQAPALLGFAYVGLVSTGLAYVVWFRGLARLPAAAVALIGLLNPVVGTVLGVVVRHERFGLVQLAGTALVLSGVVIGQPSVQAALTRRRAVPDVVPPVAAASLSR
ncbi:EamA family transporter [Angustibacter aerolatus]